MGHIDEATRKYDEQQRCVKADDLQRRLETIAAPIAAALLAKHPRESKDLIATEAMTMALCVVQRARKAVDAIVR